MIGTSLKFIPPYGVQGPLDLPIYFPRDIRLADKCFPQENCLKLRIRRRKFVVVLKI